MPLIVGTKTIVFCFNKAIHSIIKQLRKTENHSSKKQLKNICILYKHISKFFLVAVNRESSILQLNSSVHISYSVFIQIFIHFTHISIYISPTYLWMYTPFYAIVLFVRVEAVLYVCGIVWLSVCYIHIGNLTIVITTIRKRAMTFCSSCNCMNENSCQCERIEIQ